MSEEKQCCCSQCAAAELRQLAARLEAGEVALHSFETAREDLWPDVGHPLDDKRPILKVLTLRLL